MRKLQNTSWVLWVSCLLFSILIFLHYIQCNKKVKGTPKFLIKNLYFCFFKTFLYLLRTLSEIQKNSYGINLTSRFKFYLIVNLKVFLNQSFVNLKFSFFNFFFTSDVLWVKCKKVYVDVLEIFGNISPLNHFSAKQKKIYYKNLI